MQWKQGINDLEDRRERSARANPRGDIEIVKSRLGLEPLALSFWLSLQRSEDVAQLHVAA